jgi:hypothetical protein
MPSPRSKSFAVPFIALVALLASQPRATRANSCKAEGEACRTNQACCSGACVNGAPPGSKPFGMCCTPTTCAALGACGMVSDGCGGTLDCGPCPTTTTSTVTTTSSTTTTAPSCETSDTDCETQCVLDSDCPSTRFCLRGLCRPKLTNERACLEYRDCVSGCCCGRLASVCGDLEAVCRTVADCGGLGFECPGAPCGEDSDCYGFTNHTQFCTNGACAQSVPNGEACSFSAGCLSGCCCSTGVCADTASCTGGGGTCNP